MNYIIQTRYRDKPSLVNNLKNAIGIKPFWSSNHGEYENLELAKKEAERLIKYRQHLSEDIRILKVICKFDSEIIVTAKDVAD